MVGDAKGRSNVVVVEDDLKLAQILELSLSRKYDVQLAANGAEALALLAARTPDLVITDLLMPGLGGEGLLAEMRARPELNAIPVIVLTGQADEALRIRVLEHGAQDYLAKPFAVAELLARAAVHIGMRRARQVLESELLTRDATVDELAAELVRRGAQLRSTVEALALARDAAERANESKSRFLRLVSHELVTPLTATKIGLDMIARDSALAPKHVARLKRCGSSLMRLNELIQSLLEHTRIEAGMRARDVSDIDLTALAIDVVDDLRPLGEAKGITMNVQTQGVVSVASDLRVVRLIVANLVGNALKFTQNGSIVVRVASVGSRARFDVEDTGSGIAESDQSRIFEPFARADEDQHRCAPGFGLGLSLVREMAQHLGGEVRVRSQVGVGSVFTVELPRLRMESNAVA